MFLWLRGYAPLVPELLCGGAEPPVVVFLSEAALIAAIPPIAPLSWCWVVLGAGLPQVRGSAHPEGPGLLPVPGRELDTPLGWAQSLRGKGTPGVPTMASPDPCVSPACSLELPTWHREPSGPGCILGQSVLHSMASGTNSEHVLCCVKKGQPGRKDCGPDIAGAVRQDYPNPEGAQSQAGGSLGQPELVGAHSP